MPALLLRCLLQCAGDIEMNPGPFSTPTPTNCLRMMQWNANGISEIITELLPFLHSNIVNIVAIQETKLNNKTKPLKTPGWAAVRLDRNKNKGGGQQMLIKDTIHFVDNTAALPQSADPHLEQQCIAITMPNANSYTSKIRYVTVTALVTTHRSRTSSATTKCRLLLGILMHITPDMIRTRMKTKEANN